MHVLYVMVQWCFGSLTTHELLCIAHLIKYGGIGLTSALWRDLW